MKRHGLVLAVLLLVTTAAWGFVVDYTHTTTIPLNSSVDLMNGLARPEPAFGLPEWFEWWPQPQAPTSPARRADVTLAITPSRPKEGDAVTVTVSCSPVAYCYVDRADLQVRGAFLRLDLYWQPAVFFAPIDELRHIQPLGTFSPGTYSLTVINHGPFYGAASTIFTVTALEPDHGHDPMWPSWWSLMRSGMPPW